MHTLSLHDALPISFKINYNELINSVDNQNINLYVNFIVNQLFSANKYFNDQEPWKKKSDLDRVKTIIYVSFELIRKISILLYPIIPESAAKVLKVFNIKEDEINLSTITDNEFLKANTNINKSEILFKKIIND